MANSSEKSIIDGDRVFRATNVKTKSIHPVFIGLAESLSNISILRFIKIYNDRICASNLLSTDGKKETLVETNRSDLIGLELLVNPAFREVIRSNTDYSE